MALITNYSSLQAEIANTAWKSADQDYVAAVPRFIQTAEADLNRKLRTRDMLKAVTLTPASDYTVTLPSDFLGWYSVTALTSPRARLEPVTPEYADLEYPNREASWPRHFTLIGDTLEILPGTTADVKVIYYAALPALAVNDSNWLLVKAPNLYLYAALAEGAAFLKDEAEVQLWLAHRDAAITALRGEDEAGMWNAARPQLSAVLP